MLNFSSPAWLPQPLPHLDPTSEHTSCGEVVSSARQRRRMSKLQLEGHMKQVDSSERAEVDGGVKRDYSDGGCLCIDDGKSRESGPPVEGSSNVCADNTDELHMEGNTSTDGGQCIEGDRHCHIESSHDEDSDGGHQQHSGDDTNQGQKEQDWEVDDFYTLLDSTLHLSDVDVPSVPVSHKTCETLMPGELQLHSGRLAGRIRMLHK